jgi:hypothetical protein
MPIAEAAGQQQQAAEGDQVGVDDPGETGLGEAQVALDRGQGDVHHRDVEHDHEDARAEDVQGRPTGAVGLGRGVHARSDDAAARKSSPRARS